MNDCDSKVAVQRVWTALAVTWAICAMVWGFAQANSRVQSQAKADNMQTTAQQLSVAFFSPVCVKHKGPQLVNLPRQTAGTVNIFPATVVCADGVTKVVTGPQVK